MGVTDWKNLIKVCECCLTDEINCDDCPYSLDSFAECQRKLHNGVIELLKKQEPMRVLSQRESVTLFNRYKRKGFCPNCNQVVEWYLNRLHCGFCGQELKWE